LTLKKLQRDWEKYAWVFWRRGKSRVIILYQYYSRCEFVNVKGVLGLKFFLHHDDGSWCHTWDIMRCDKKGNCYHFTFLTNNITKYVWKKRGKFITLERLLQTFGRK